MEVGNAGGLLSATLTDAFVLLFNLPGLAVAHALACIYSRRVALCLWRLNHQRYLDMTVPLNLAVIIDRVVTHDATVPTFLAVMPYL